MSSSDGDQPVAKRQKTYEADGFGPVEDDKTAREKLQEAGFDPDDVHTARSDLVPPLNPLGSWYNITPMTHFSILGDLPMCRYLYHVRGASTTAPTDDQRTEMGERTAHGAPTRFWFPMQAAVSRNKISVAKWLFCNGAKGDVRRFNSYSNTTPFAWCLSLCKREKGSEDLTLRHPDLAKWFILNGALDDSDGNFDADALKSALIRVVDRLRQQWSGSDGLQAFFLDWANGIIKPTESFHAFLLGTLREPECSSGSSEALQSLCSEKPRNVLSAKVPVDGTISNGTCRSVWGELKRKPANNACLEAFPGVLERIADYVGITKSKSKVRKMVQFRAAISSLSVDEFIDRSD